MRDTQDELVPQSHYEVCEQCESRSVNTMHENLERYTPHRPLTRQLLVLFPQKSSIISGFFCILHECALEFVAASLKETSESSAMHYSSTTDAAAMRSAHELALYYLFDGRRVAYQDTHGTKLVWCVARKSQESYPWLTSR